MWLAFDREISAERDAARELVARARTRRARACRTAHAQRGVAAPVPGDARAAAHCCCPRTHPASRRADWRFVNGEYGKPELGRAVRARSGCISMSRTPRAWSRSRWRAAAARDRRGELAYAHRATADRATAISPPEEARELDSAAARENKSGGSIALWTLKESWIKATGRGLAAGLDNVAFVLRSGTRRRERGDRRNDDARALAFLAGARRARSTCWRWRRGRSRPASFACACSAGCPRHCLVLDPLVAPRALGTAAQRASGQEQRAQA